jgi:hypothetical protein
MKDPESIEPAGRVGRAPSRGRQGLGEMLDTSPEARRFYFQTLARLGSAGRLALMEASSRMIRNLAEAAIRKDHPGAGAHELRVRVAVRLYGRELAERVLGGVPADAR